MKFNFSVFCLFFCVAALLLTSNQTVHSRVLYGISVPEKMLRQEAVERMNRQLEGSGADAKTYISAVEQPRYFNDQTGTFFLLLGLIAAVAIFRQSNPVYFRNLFRAARNATLSARQLREPLEQNNVANILLDIIFSISLACYLYFALGYLFPDLSFQGHSQLAVIAIMVLGILLVYLFRFLALRFTGWVFGIPDIMSHYAFNIRLINKVEGIVLIPFTVILAFGSGNWVQATFFISLIIILLLLINRYVRSRQAFQYFLTYSKLHFFLYLCASEILPLALLIKVSMTWLNNV